MDSIEFLKDPFIPNDIIEYLEEFYTVNYLLNTTAGTNSDFRLGYMQGVIAVINHLKFVRASQEDEAEEKG